MSRRAVELRELVAHLGELISGVDRWLERPPYVPDLEVKALRSRLQARLAQALAELRELETAPSSPGREGGGGAGGA